MPEDAPLPSFNVFELGLPVLGICYGLQIAAYQLAGEVDSSAKREFGRANLIFDNTEDLFAGIENNSTVWMSHGDALTKAPDAMKQLHIRIILLFALVRNKEKKIYGVQFHPEVHHTTFGKNILDNFVRKICELKDIWSAESFVGQAINEIKEKIGNAGVICALSGGVDSTVLAVLLHKAIGKQLHCIHVDSGLMRKNESEKIYKLFKEHFDISIDVIDASEDFLGELEGVTEPEQKRKIIGRKFIEIFEKEAIKFNDAKWLAQGTLYPDVIESVSVKGPSATINPITMSAAYPEKMNLKILEPFRELFKDEVRAVGRQLGVPDWFVDVIHSLVRD